MSYAELKQQTSMKVAIHQPDFFPWLGLFHKICLGNKFVIFDHVQAPTGKHWTNRNKILLNNQIKWLTIPIKKKGHTKQKYTDILINYENNFERKHLGSLKQAYGKTPYFEEIFAIIERLYNTRYEKLCDFNKEYLKIITERLGFNVIFESSSSYLAQNPELFDLSGNELILKICLHANAAKYISGTGCLDFIQPEEFKKHGIRFFFQKFVHPEYPQQTNSTGEFISHLSSLDALFNVGIDGMRTLISNPMIEEV